jgi:acetoin:2,6-dichlorophenolindophenol oxidoreductase subunit beta
MILSFTANTNISITISRPTNCRTKVCRLDVRVLRAKGAISPSSLAAAEELAREGLEVEVVDLRTVKPLDTDTVLASVARTGRLLCVGESFPWGGTNAEVIARVTSQGFHLLDAAPQRLNAKDTPIPYHPNLWSAHRPNAKNIVAKARALLRE